MRHESPRSLLAGMIAELGVIADGLVFVGGQITPLLITDAAAVRLRPTIDVDAIVDVDSRSRFHELEQHLTRQGFRSDQRPEAPICRWLSPAGRVLDLMPVDPGVLGFSNRWYPLAIARTTALRLPDNRTLHHPTAPVFLATKLAAHLDRSASDLLGSHDLEDVITLIAGRRELAQELSGEPVELRAWIAETLRDLRRDTDFVYAIHGALPDADRIPRLITRTLDRIDAMISAERAPHPPHT
jgi:hypothetical protein